MNMLSRTSTIALLMLCASRADAQLGGVLRRLPGGVGDAARAAEMLRQANDAKQTPSPLAGTYRLVYVFGPPAQPKDSLVVYARTFDKPSTGTVGGDLPLPGNAAVGAMTQGYMLTLVADTTLDALPSTPEIAADLRVSLEMLLEHSLDADNADFRRLLLSDSMYLNGRLSDFYKAGLPASAEFQEVQFEPERRSGIITHPFLLSGFLIKWFFLLHLLLPYWLFFVVYQPF